MTWIARDLGRARILFGSAEPGPAPAGPVFVHQVHGITVIDAAVAGAQRPEGDALVTDQPDVVCAIRTADCAPVVLVAGNGDAIALVHAGWRGLLDGVLQRSVDAVRARTDAPIHALLGPCVHPQHYEFADPELGWLADRYGAAVRARTVAGAPALDVPAAVEAALAEVGVVDVASVGVDTFASPVHHSWRRDHSDARNVTYAWIEP